MKKHPEEWPRTPDIETPLVYLWTQYEGKGVSTGQQYLQYRIDPIP